ncbi:glycosyl transferase family 2 [Hanstruepera neustonica]|uniref:Glycosyl transferase family 2 n=1 Tax=Hanstruepera neustonica TaxID=1445657 RepID=A0A2K1DYR9_9FLAO|nr:glycosyltransferase family 2 protein [Hanstruepera neustonica]PNQ73176.1 glycosyl transferase family 2 [Hanstruepera neustonica]
MQNELISILTPFKNTAEFLQACLDSIINQTYENWELLIVNDHSTDESNQIVLNYAKSDSRIKLFQNNGTGIIESLRLAFKNSQGTYITRMDSDDIMTPNKLEILIGNLKKYGQGHVAVGKVKYFSDVGISDGYSKYEKWINGLTEKGINYSEIYKECVIPSPCWMIHRNDLILCNAFNPNFYPEDYDLTFRFYKYDMICIPCHNILHHWRDYSTRTSRTHEHYAQNYFLEIKLKYFLELDYDSNRSLVIWGAGFKGKTIAKLLVDNNVPFHWICDNPKKIGKHIYNQEMLPFSVLKTIKNPQSIITVANEQAQKEIRKYFESLNLHPVKDYFFFC